MRALVVLLGCLTAVSVASAMQSDRSIRVTIVDMHRAPLPGVSISVKNTETSVGWNGLTDAKGIYEARPVPPGAYTVSYSLGGYSRTVRQELTANIGQLRLTYSIPSIQIKIIDRRGGVVDVLVSVTKENSDLHWDGVTDRAGMFEAKAVPQGRYTIHYTDRPGGLPKTDTLELADGQGASPTYMYDSGGAFPSRPRRVPEKTFQITEYKDTVKGRRITFSGGQGATVASTVFGSVTLSLPGNPKHRVGELGAELMLVLVPHSFKGAPDPGNISLSASITGGPQQMQIVGGEINSPAGKTSAESTVFLPPPASGAVTWSWQVRALGPFDPGSLRVLLRATQDGNTITAADLPQDVEYAAKPLLIERFQTLFFGSVANSVYTAVLSALTTALIGFWRGRKSEAAKLASRSRGATAKSDADLSPAEPVAQERDPNRSE